MAELAVCIGLRLTQLNGLLATLHQQYRTFTVPKRSGDPRTIRAPSRELKRVQHRLLDLLTPLVPNRQSSHGFVRGRDIMSNAREHVGQRNVLNVDISNFFGSIHPGRVAGALRASPVGLNADIAKVVARLCTTDNGLPQGAPTSPVLANLVAWTLDRDLERLAKAHRCFYTRYADDLTFSTNAPRLSAVIFDDVSRQAGSALVEAIQKGGFSLNAAKTRLHHANSRQVVTGLVTNVKTNVDRRLVREVRSSLHAVEKFGLASAQKLFETKYHGTSAPDLLARLKGQVLFIGQVRGFGDDLYRKLVARLTLIEPKLKLPVAPSRVERLEECVWVIESAKTFKQGSGFWLEGVGLVTNDHVVEDDSVAFTCRKPNNQFKVAVVARDHHRDLAILDIQGPKPVGLQRGDPTRLHQLSAVTVVGFPGYSPGSDLMLKPAFFAGRKNRHGVKAFILDAGITAGGSGGPVLNSDDEVVGIAVTGGANLDEAKAAVEYGVIYVSELDAVATAK